MAFYDDIDVHRRVVGDDVRTRAFFESITATVSPGDVVLDVGSGSGILSLFAAQAGASRVYAVDRAPAAAALARRLIADNSMQDRIQIIVGEAERVALPTRVNVLVSEWLGVYGVDENMLGSVLAARDRWLESDGTLIPGAVTAWLAPVSHPAGTEAAEWHTRRYDLDLAALAPFSLDEAVSLPPGTEPASLRAQPQAMWAVDPQTMSTVEATSPFLAELSFTLEGGDVNGLLAWFSASMPGAVDLSNAPGLPATHWGQFLFPLASVGEATAGDELLVTFECVPAGALGSHHRWSARTAEGNPEMHDTRRPRRAQWMPPWRVSYAGWTDSQERSVTQ